MFERMICDPEILGEKPLIKGTRISVEILLEWLASGATAQEIVETAFKRGAPAPGGR